MNDLMSSLEILSRLASMGSEYEYANTYDFVVREGTEYAPSGLPSPSKAGVPRRCFGNSALASAIHGFRYVEGYASSEASPTMPVHHAWNLDEDGNVVDLTWTGEVVVPYAYCGVVFDDRFVFDAMNKKRTIIDDWQNDWPILRKKWGAR